MKWGRKYIYLINFWMKKRSIGQAYGLVVIILEVLYIAHNTMPSNIEKNQFYSQVLVSLKMHCYDYHMQQYGRNAEHWVEILHFNRLRLTSARSFDWFSRAEVFGGNSFIYIDQLNTRKVPKFYFANGLRWKVKVKGRHSSWVLAWVNKVKECPRDLFLDLSILISSSTI